MMYDDAKEKIRSIDSAWSNAVAEMVDARIELHRLRDDTIFDEDKSVRWNRDEAVRRKDALSKKIDELADKKESLQESYQAAVMDYLMDGWGLSIGAAKVVYDKAYDDGYACGMTEVLRCADEYARFIDKVMSAQAKS